jgi:hypothetical protein
MDSFTDPLTGAQVSVTNMNGQESVSIGPAPSSMSGIASIASNPITSALVNAGLTAAIPGYGPANLGVMGLTGTSIYGQGVSLATGQGLQTGGGLMGLMGGSGQSFGEGPSNAGVAEGYGGGGGDVAPTVWTMSNEAKQGSEVIAPPAAPKPVSPYSFNIADFIAPAPQQGYRPLVI